MKPPYFARSARAPAPDQRGQWWIRLTIVVILVALITCVAPVSAKVVVAQADLPTNSYGCSGRYHTVRPGETIYSIAARYGSTAYRIRSCNGLSSSTVRVGQRLLVPIRSSSSSSWIEGIDFARDTAATPLIVAEMTVP